jgi:hypothetical protein
MAPARCYRRARRRCALRAAIARRRLDAGRINQGLLAINPIAFDDSDAAVLGAAIKECMA